MSSPKIHSSSDNIASSSDIRETNAAQGTGGAEKTESKGLLHFFFGWMFKKEPEAKAQANAATRKTWSEYLGIKFSLPNFANWSWSKSADSSATDGIKGVNELQKKSEQFIDDVNADDDNTEDEMDDLLQHVDQHIDAQDKKEVEATMDDLLHQVETKNNSGQVHHTTTERQQDDNDWQLVDQEENK